MNKIVFFGASNTAKISQPGGKTYATLCAEKLGLELKTYATPSASNAFLIRNVLEHIEKNKDDLVIVGWQSWEREEWLIDGVYYQISPHMKVESNFLDRYRLWLDKLTIDNTDVKANEWHEKIWNLHTLLKSSKVKHIFFNSQYPFVSKNQYNWGTNFIGPYDNNSSCHWYLVNECKIYPDNSYHFEQDGHTAWADFLISYIEKNKIL
jgi:hypothetical protein